MSTINININMNINLNTRHLIFQLYEAILTHDITLITSLLHSGTDVNFQEMNGRSLLHFAIGKAKFAPSPCTTEISIVELLLAHGANPNVQDINGRTPLHTITMKKSFRYSRNVFDDDSETKYNIIKMLLDHGANPNIQDTDSDTPLHNAIESLPTDSSSKIIEILLKSGADSNIENIYGNTALHYAAKLFLYNTVFQFIEMLLEHDANPNIKNIDDDTALDLLIADNSHIDDIRYVETIEKLTQLVRIYNRKIFLSACKGFNQYNIALNAALTIGEHMHLPLPVNALINIFKKSKKCF